MKLGADNDLDVTVVFAITNMKFAGREKYVKIAHIKEERERVLREINEADPDLTFCFGRTAASSAFGKGSIVLAEHARQCFDLDNIGGQVVVIDSLSRVAAQPGITQWLELDVQAACMGWTETQWGDYTVIKQGDVLWHDIPEDLKGCRKIGFDLETYPAYSPWDKDARIRMAIVSCTEEEAYIIQIPEHTGEIPPWLEKICADPEVLKGGAWIGFDVDWMRRMGYEVNNVWDTCVAEHLIDETNPKKDLKNLAFKYAPHLADYSKGHRDLVKKRKGWEYVKDDEMYLYAGGDGEASFTTMESQMEEIGGQQATKLAMDLYPVLTEMKIMGAAFDMQCNSDLDIKFNEELSILRDKIQQVLGPINPASPAQLVKSLKTHVKGIRLTNSKLIKFLNEEGDEEIDDSDSTARDVLEREASKHPVIADLLEFRRLHKLHGTYIKGTREKHVYYHGLMHYVHPSYNQARVETNRLSCSNPNFQNIPRKPKEGEPEWMNVKKQFISRFKGGSIMEADYSQAELRVAAHESQDKGLLAAFASGRDVHMETAAMLLAKEYEDITDDERQRCKTLNFLIVYGGGARTLAEALDISVDEAKELMNRYFRAFPRLKRYIASIHKKVEKDLRVVSGFGFTRRFAEPDIWHSPKGWAIKRQAFNHIIQNTAACLTYCSIIEINAWMKKAEMKSVMFGTVHDSILFDIFPGEEEKMANKVKFYMENVDTEWYGYKLDVPLGADIEIGPNWGEKKLYFDDE